MFRLYSNLITDRATGIVAVAVLALAAGTVATGQKQKTQSDTANKITAKLISLEKKGRVTILKVETTDQGEQEYIINSRVEFAVRAKGDEGFLTKGRFVRAEAVESNKHLFAKNCVIVLSGRGRKPIPVFKKAPVQPGGSTNSYLVAGTVVSLQKDGDYPDYDSLTIRIGRKEGKVLLEKGYTVAVHTSDAELAKAGAQVELEGKPAKGNRFLLAKATVILDETLKAEDFPATGSNTKKRTKKKD